MRDEDRVGARVAALRKSRGLTGRQLARRAHISYSLLAKVESGHVPATPTFVGAVARALGVDVARLTGQPYQDPADATARLQAMIEPLRRALLTHDLPPALDLPSRAIAELRADVARLSSLGRQARYLQLGHALPPLLDDLVIALEAAPERDRPTLYALLAEAYGGISALAHMIGYLDLRALAVARIAWAARRSGDHLRVARTEWSRGASLLGVAAYDEGLALMARVRATLGEDVDRMDEPTRSVYGSLHLRSAILAARAARRDEAEAHLREAHEIARRVNPTANHYGMEFGPANVAVHGMSVAVELADGGLAARRASAIERAGTLDDLPPVRVGHYHIEAARGWLYAGDRRRALASLRRARRVAPQQVRHHPMVRETVLAIAHSEPRPSEDLRAFAFWLGLDR